MLKPRSGQQLTSFALLYQVLNLGKSNLGRKRDVNTFIYEPLPPMSYKDLLTALAPAGHMNQKKGEGKSKMMQSARG